MTRQSRVRSVIRGMAGLLLIAGPIATGVASASVKADGHGALQAAGQLAGRELRLTIRSRGCMTRVFVDEVMRANVSESSRRVDVRLRPGVHQVAIEVNAPMVLIPPKRPVKLLSDVSITYSDEKPGKPLLQFHKRTEGYYRFKIKVAVVPCPGNDVLPVP